MKPAALRVLDALREKPGTTNQLRGRTGCSAIAQRVQELREAGWTIRMEIITVRNKHGEKVQAGHYTLVSEPRGMDIKEAA